MMLPLGRQIIREHAARRATRRRIVSNGPTLELEMTEQGGIEMTEQGHAILLDKIDKLETLDAKLQLIYEWVKTGHINLAQFKRLTCDIIQADITYRLAIAVGDLSDD